jgi:hypothetical protein
MFKIKIEKNLLNLVNPIEKVPPQATKFSVLDQTAWKILLLSPEMHLQL